MNPTRVSTLINPEPLASSSRQRERKNIGQRPKIAILTNYPYDGKNFTGGVETATAGLLEGLQKHNDKFEFHVLALTRDIASDRTEQRMGMMFHFLAIPSRWYQRPNVIPNIFNTRSALQRLRPDVVHCQDNMALAIGALMTKPQRKLFTVHGIKSVEARVWEGPEYWSTRMDAMFEMWVRKRFDEVITISPYVNSFLPLHVRKHHIPNPVQSLFFEQPQDGREEHRRFLFVAGIVRLKRPHDMLSALVTIQESFPDVRLTVAGPMFDSAYEREMREFVAEKHLNGVDFLGGLSQKRIAELMRTSTALVVTSSQENSPMVIAEAMASGLPVIASRVGGIPAMISESEDGLMFDSGNVEQLTERCTLMLSDPQLRVRLSTHGSRTAKERYSPDAVAQATIRVYERIMGELS